MASVNNNNHNYGAGSSYSNQSYSPKSSNRQSTPSASSVSPSSVNCSGGAYGAYFGYGGYCGSGAVSRYDNKAYSSWDDVAKNHTACQAFSKLSSAEKRTATDYIILRNDYEQAVKAYQNCLQRNDRSGYMDKFKEAEELRKQLRDFENKNGGKTQLEKNARLYIFNREIGRAKSSGNKLTHNELDYYERTLFGQGVI